MRGTGAWTPTRVLAIGTNSRAARGAKTAVAFAFTATRGTWTLDDVYFDPYRKG